MDRGFKVFLPSLFLRKELIKAHLGKNFCSAGPEFLLNLEHHFLPTLLVLLVYIALRFCFLCGFMKPDFFWQPVGSRILLCQQNLINYICFTIIACCFIIDKEDRIGGFKTPSFEDNGIAEISTFSRQIISLIKLLNSHPIIGYSINLFAFTLLQIA